MLSMTLLAGRQSSATQVAHKRSGQELGRPTYRAVRLHPQLAMANQITKLTPQQQITRPLAWILPSSAPVSKKLQMGLKVVYQQRRIAGNFSLRPLAALVAPTPAPPIIACLSTSVSRMAGLLFPWILVQ